MDGNVYRKKENGRYEAIGLQYDRDWLTDGIWCVSRTEDSTSIRNISHYGGIYKVGDAKYPDFSKLAGVLEVANLVAQSDAVHEMLSKPHNLMDACTTIITEAVKYAEQLEQKSQKRPLKCISKSTLLEDGFEKKGKTKFEKVIEGTWYKVVIVPEAYENPRFSRVEVFSTYDNEKRAEFKAEYLHQVYRFIKDL